MRREDDDADELAQERGRGGAAPEAVADVEDDESEQAREEKRSGHADREPAVVPRARIRHRHVEPGEDEYEPDDEQESCGRGQDASVRPRRRSERRAAHAAAILCAAARGSAASWNKRMAATPAIRSP